MTTERGTGTGRPPSEEDKGLRATGGLRGAGAPPDAVDESGGAAGSGGGREELRGEDLTKGPTPETRHPEGGVDDVRDTTEGPTPETRLADRQAELEDEGHARASGQPEADRDTRGEVGGDQV